VRRQKETQLQPHTRIDFTNNFVVLSSSSPCFLSFEAREEVKEAKKRKKKQTLEHKTRVFSKHQCWVGTRNWHQIPYPGDA
jgi:hypothetical protein